MTALLLGFRNLLAWTLVDKRERKGFDVTWYIGTIVSYNLQRQWFAVEYCDGTEDRACSAVVIALRFGTQGPGFEPGLSHKACYMPLHDC